MSMEPHRRAADDYDPIPQDAINLYDAFTHGTLDRRSFMERLSLLTGSATAATVLLGRLQNNYAHAAMIAENDPRLAIEEASFDSPDGPIKAMVASPKGGAKTPAVLVIHENRGLNPHIRDVARRMALEGFVAIAPDGLTPEGGTPTNEDAARDLIGKLEPAKANGRFLAAVAFGKAHPLSTGKVGAVGFCWGGGMANALAVGSPDMIAAVAYYGRQPAAADVPKIKGAVMLHYASKDDRINAGIADYEAALKAAKTDYQLFMYDGAQHAFNNDSNPARYDKTAADLAWGRTIAFLKAKLA
jgi:carboxymethylenebutenolidase